MSTCVNNNMLWTDKSLEVPFRFCQFILTCVFCAPCVCFFAPQVLPTITRTLCTQTATICLVQTTSRSSLIGPHISKHWCCSCAPTPRPPALLVARIFPFRAFLTFSCFPLLPSVCWADRWKGETGDGERTENIAPSVRQSDSQMGGHCLCWACWLRWRSCSKPSFTPVIITWVHCGSAAQTHWDDTKLTAQLTESTDLISLQCSITYFSELYWMFRQHKVQHTWHW